MSIVNASRWLKVLRLNRGNSIRNIHWEIFLNEMRIQIERKKMSLWGRLKDRLADNRLIFRNVFLLWPNDKEHQLIRLSAIGT